METNMRRKSKNEEGIALLFTLGMLALLLVMAMAFASTARLGKKAATNNAELTSARYLAESALQRAMGAMRFYRETGGSQYDNMISHDVSGSVNQKTFDWLYNLETLIDGAEIYKWPAPYDPELSDAIHWQYVDNGRPPLGDPSYDANNPQKIIGRIAYKVFGSGGKLDPSACVRHTTAINGVPAGTAVPEVIIPAPALPALPTDTAVRNGNYVCEINIQNLTRTDVTNLPAADVVKLSSNLAGGLLEDSERWSDWGTLFSLMGIPSVTSANKAKREKWRSWFDIERPADAEAFWIDSSGDGIEEPSELYHRFNLGREENNPNYPGTEPNNPGWSQLTVDDILSDPVEYSEAGGKYYGKGIKWLNNYANLTAETFPSAQIRAKQIAANLIDYCDNDRAAHTDSTTAPTYTGNDQSPYINEVQLMVDGDVSDPLGNGVYYCNVFLVADVEVVNMYQTTDNKSFNLRAMVTVSGTYGWGPKNSTRTFTDVVIPLTINAVGDRCYKFGTSAAIDVSDGTWSDSPPAWGQIRKIDHFKFTKINVKLTDLDNETVPGNGTFYDYSYIESNSDTVDVKVDSDDNDRYYFFDYQIDDPRQNLNLGDWADADDSNGHYHQRHHHHKKESDDTLGARNNSDAYDPNPGGNRDVETGAVEPWDVSTAYIRNSYMRSPWELGFINRGDNWDTLRIYLYNRNDDNDGNNNESGEWGASPSMGISTWDKGDANILDQIKMSGATECFGKINLNTTNNDVLMALIGGIRIGVSPNPNSATVRPYPRLPNSSGTTTDGTDDSDPGALSYGSELVYAGVDDVNYIAIAATNSIKVPGASAAAGAAFLPYKTRAQVASTITQALSSGARFTQTTDALKEEVIGKFINLTKATPDTVTIIVVAQTLKDVGGGITVNKDLDGDGNIGGIITESGYDIDGKDSNNDGDYTNDPLPNDCEIITDCQFGQYDQYADEILAEQKIMAIVIYDQTTQKWRILRYEYLE
ncbi:MAG TPA: hypothetical protein DET40_13110 [Lentisphaeria bacterium]|nr:MAG: hypothetical protein A2X45_17420 [Lentisphaerae bacterium GWF2_50_93]HCE44481.1 hypothetical protein [Lentisphaeria bacterium]